MSEEFNKSLFRSKEIKKLVDFIINNIGSEIRIITTNGTSYAHVINTNDTIEFNLTNNLPLSA